jgi:quinoprotein glucose dehydrogenase
MLPPSLRPATGVLALVAALVLVIALPRAFAAELAPTASAGRGKLKDMEVPRQLAPIIESASDEGQQALSRMKLPAGLKASLWAAEPMLANPVAFNLDEQGRVFVAETHRYRTSVLDIRDYMWTLEDDLDNRTQEDFLASIRRNFGETGVQELSKESERLMLLEDTNGDGKADKSSVYADNFRGPMDGIASGVLIHRGDVWFTNIPALWKFTGKNKAETRTEMFRGFGIRFNFTGHDFHGLALGPDGRVYFSIGDRAASVPTKEDGVVSAPDTGSVFRCWPDGSGFELFATGLRNPQSLAFNEYGDLFTGDNDSDQGDEERLVHLVEDGDSGWRIGYQFAPRNAAGPWNAEKLWHPRHASQPAYLLPPICNIEDGPSGIAYYPGTGLTPDYAGNLFITHFKGAITNSGIYAYKMKPDGASYAIDTAAPFLTGALPTDVRFGPDGKMYYSDWAEGWPKSKKGRIYSIYDEKLANSAELKVVQALIASDFTKKSDKELAALLAHADWRVRLEAQYSLAERGDSIAPLAKIAGTATDFSRLHAVWALGQIARKDLKATEALRTLLSNADAEVRAQAANTLGDLRDAASAEALVKSLTDSAPRVKFFAAQAIGKLKYAAALPDLLAAVRANDDTDAYLRHALVIALSRCATAEQFAALATDDSRAVRLAAVLALRRQGSPEVTKFLTDKDLFIVRETVEAINDAPIPAATPALAAIIARPVNDEAIMLRVLNANFRLGTAENAAALAAFVAGNGSPVLRKEALALLALWPAPPARDRIVGIFRPLAEKSRPTDAAAAALAPKLADLFAAHTPDMVQLSAIDAVAGLKITSAYPALHAVVADKGQSSSVRAAALKALDGLDAPGLAATAAIAAASDLPDLRLTALPVNSRLAPDTAVANLAGLISAGTPKEQQTAFRALGAAKDPAADDVILAQLGQLAAGKVVPATQLDLLDAAALRSDPRVKQVLAARDAALAKDLDPLAPYRVTLEGGNAQAGGRTFAYNPIMQCARCHRYNEEAGGEAGPNLAGIGARESREYILQSIIKPSAKIATGYEIVTVNKKNGESLVGTLVQRDEKTVRLKTSDSTIDLPAADIKGIESAPSAMPEIAALVLTKSEIRDLVEAVASLKTPVKPRDQIPLRALRKLDGK